MKIVIKDFRTEGDNKLVGFKVTEGNNVFAIDKQVALAEGKTDEQYITEALSAGQSEIDDWKASFAHVGKEWNAETNAFVEAPAAEDSE